MYKNLTDFINTLEKEGELIRIKASVDPILEIAELTDRQAKSPGGGRALLFENTGTEFPVITNMMGSERRIALALGVGDGTVAEIPARIEALFREATAPRRGMMDKLRALPMLGQVSGWMPRSRSGRGECQAVVMQGDDVDLGRLPVLKCWPLDGGRFVTLPLVTTLDPDTGVRNVGMYRMQIFDEHTTGMHWHRHKTGERHYQRYKALGERMPVAVCLGGDPAYTYSATAPLPDGIDEWMLAGFLRQRPVDLVRCVTVPLDVPADCDFVIEGYVDTAQELAVEGDFGDHTGFYSLQDLYPQLHVTCITHRRGAVYPATVVGVPPQEDSYIGWATERIFLEPLRLAVVPELRDMWIPSAGVAHNIVVVTIRKSYAGQAFKVANALWGAGQMGFNKYLIVLSDEGGVPTGEAEYIDMIRERLHWFDPERDTLFSRGVLDVLDHSAPALGFGGKLCLDLTTKEGYVQAEGVRTRRESIPVEITFDEGVEGLSFDDLAWLAGGNSDPMRDVSISGGVLHIDARVKAITPPPDAHTPASRRVWPSVVCASMSTIEMVDRRWGEYGLGEFIPSPSRKYRLLS